MTKEPFGVTLARAHLETEFTDYAIIGIKKEETDIKLHTVFCAQDKQTLDFLVKTFAEKARQIP